MIPATRKKELAMTRNLILDAVQGKVIVRNHYGELVELDEWSPDIARKIAAEEGLTLTDEHFQVLNFLRDYFINQNGSTEDAHQILRSTEEYFANKGGRRWLYQLFPRGPMVQGMKIAGLPVPPHATDPSFGSVS
jgi:tRNA 2-thiouridine synthesizing protein E